MNDAFWDGFEKEAARAKIVGTPAKHSLKKKVVNEEHVSGPKAKKAKTPAAAANAGLGQSLVHSGRVTHKKTV